MPPKSRTKPLDAFFQSETVVSFEVKDSEGIGNIGGSEGPEGPEGSVGSEGSEGSAGHVGSEGHVGSAGPNHQPQMDPVGKTEAPPVVPVKKPRARGSSSKKEDKPTEHVIVQLPIPDDKIDRILTEGIMEPSVVEGAPIHSEPLYAPLDAMPPLAPTFMDSTVPTGTTSAPHSVCYWCCHCIGAHKYGMPILYDPIHQSFHQYGSFCSLECAAAHNFSTHLGSDRVWEIHGWIQLLAKRLGIEPPIRPAPSRFLLQMFGGPLSIDQFRMCHKSMQRAYVMNIPPLIHVSAQTEVLNISYLYERVPDQEEPVRNKLARKKPIMDTKRTLDSKMNLTYETIAVAEE